MAQVREKVEALIAKDSLEEADSLVLSELEKCKAAKDDKGAANVLLASAEVSLCQMKVEKSLQASREAWNLAKTANDPVLSAEAILAMIGGLLKIGKSKDALRAAQTSDEVVKKAGKPALEARLYSYKANAYARLGDANDALETAQKAMAIYKASGDKKGQAVSLTTIAKATRMAGKFEEAVATAKEACAAWRALGQAAGIVAALETLAEAQAAEGYPKASLAAAEEELSLLQKAGVDKKNEIIMMEKVAQIASDAGQTMEALRTMEAMIKVCKTAGDQVGEAEKTLQTAEMHAGLNHAQDAIRLAKEAETLFTVLNDKAGEEECKKLQTSICVKRNQHAKAPHRSEALMALRNFVRAVEARETNEVKKFEEAMDRASSAIKDSEMTNALEALFERDPAALHFLEETGWDLQTFKVPTLMTQFPHKAFYLQTIAGGMNFGPQFRSVHPWKKGLSSDLMNTRSISVNQLPETESWQGVILYRHGIIDGGIQASGQGPSPP